MEFKGIKKVHSGKFISRYDIEYKTIDNKKKIYEVISRNHSINSLQDLQNKKANSVVLIMHNKANNKILLNKEFRMAVGEWVYNFPAGLIDNDENPEECAKRELKEETGLNLCEIKEKLESSYGAVGFSNEINITIIGIAEGEFSESYSTFEEIEANWYTKEEVKNLLKTETFAGRTQLYCYMWSNK